MTHVKLRELFERSPKISLNFVNLTSETKVPEGVFMMSATQEGCLLLLPKNCCAKGHQILLVFEVETKKSKKKKIEVVGKVVELNPVSEKEAEGKVQLNQFVKEEWLSLLGIFEQKQQQITEVMETLKTPKSC